MPKKNSHYKKDKDGSLTFRVNKDNKKFFNIESIRQGSDMSKLLNLFIEGVLDGTYVYDQKKNKIIGAKK